MIDLNDEFVRILAETVEQTRSDTLDICIELCEDMGHGHTGTCCAAVLRNLKASLRPLAPPAPRSPQPPPLRLVK